MNISMFVSMLFCLQFFYWFVGLRASKNSQEKEDYFLAGKSVQLFPLMMTFLATQVGGGVILGAADEAFQFGWPVLLYPLGAALGLIMLGCGVGSRLSEFKVSTVAQLFEVVYGSALLRKVASILSMISLFMILVAQIIASNKFLISLGFDNNLLFILFWSIVILYTAQGGLRAVISTDMVQAAFFSFVFLFCFGFVLFYEPSITLIQMPHVEQFEKVSSKICGWLLMPLLFMVIEQDMGQRCFAGASPKTVSRASLVAGILTMVICVIPVVFGYLANVTEIEVTPGGSVLMAMITKTTNPWITSLVGCAIVAAIISTATSLINAISSNVSSDFLLNSGSMKTTKVITGFIAIGALYFAFYFNNIIDLLIQSYELSVSCLFVPVWMALFRKQRHFMSASLAISFGAAGFCLFRIYPIDFPKEVASLLLSWLGFGLGDALIRTQRLFERKQPRRRLNALK